jgi:hypothetical protein
MYRVDCLTSPQLKIYHALVRCLHHVEGAVSERLTVAQLVKKIQVFYGTLRFITATSP